jgi:hypothetical protein
MYQPPVKKQKIAECVNCKLPTDDRLCVICSSLAECQRCHKRLNSGWFIADSNICFTCSNRPLEQKKYSLNEVLSVVSIPCDESSVDLEAFILAQSDKILEAINNAIQEKRLVILSSPLIFKKPAFLTFAMCSIT